MPAPGDASPTPERRDRGAARRRAAAGLLPCDGWRATAWYLALTLVLTWPLAQDFARRLPGDFGDPLLVCWIIGWNAEHLLDALGGDVDALRRMYHASIFHPEPYTLAYSELLLAQTVQVVPLYAATKNLVLCYNATFAATFVLSGLGTFLLVREITGDWRAAFVAGLVFAFAPYRIDQLSHLQSLSSQWMPFTIYGLRRFFDTGRPRALAGGTLALLAQNLSCGYYLLYFNLFVPAYVLFELARRGRLGDWRTWRRLAVAAAFVAGATLTCLFPYVLVRDAASTRRQPAEVRSYSADAGSYFTAHHAMNVWGQRVRAYPRPEGGLFAGFTALALAALGAGRAARLAWHASARAFAARPAPPIAWPAPLRRLQPLVVWTAALVMTGYVAALVTMVGWGSGRYRVFGEVVRLTNLRRVVTGMLLALAVLVVASPAVRRLVIAPFRAGRELMGDGVFFTACTAAAWLLSLGPEIHVLGTHVGAGPYAFLYEHVPGFDGVRVPARMAMVVFLFLAVVGGDGLHAMLSRTRRLAGLVVAIVGLLVVLESAALPLPLAGRTPAGPGLVEPPPRIETGNAFPRVYHALAELPPDAVIVEFPIGDETWDVRFTYYSVLHKRRLLNGYSGHFPGSFLRHTAYLHRPWLDPEGAWNVLLASGATHAVVHAAAFEHDAGARVAGWLEARGARRMARFGDDLLYALPHAARPAQGHSPGGTT